MNTRTKERRTKCIVVNWIYLKKVTQKVEYGWKPRLGPEPAIIY